MNYQYCILKSQLKLYYIFTHVSLDLDVCKDLDFYFSFTLKDVSGVVSVHVQYEIMREKVS